MRSVVVILISLFLGYSCVEGQDTRQLEREKPLVSDGRTALVIGIGTYQNARALTNSVNDATDMANALSSLGFEVIYGVDLNLKQMSEKVREFGDKLKSKGGVGMFYYAGHGIQVGGRNYLIPVEANILREDEIADGALNFDVVLRKMATANNGLNIVVLDACRNNPFARSWSRGGDEGGLAQINAPTGTFIAYATSPDRTASDGSGRNGLYTSELLKVLPDPALKIEDAFKRVTIAVDRASGGEQIPWTSSSLRGEFYFKTDEKNSKIVKETNTAAIMNDKPFAPPVPPDLADWNKIKDSKNPMDLTAYMEKYPNSPYSQVAAARIRSYSTDALGGILGGNTASQRTPAFLIDGDKRTQMKVAVTKQDYNIGGGGVMGIGRGGVKTVMAFNGARSLLRVGNNPPEIEVTLADGSVNISDVIIVLKLKPKADTREVQTMQKTFSGFKKEDMVTVSFQEQPPAEGAHGKLYRIKFAGPLAAGEYAVFSKEALADGGIFSRIQMSGAESVGTFYDFGVDQK
ncbi:MAG: caspase family protein [Acidobacteriota bacterium]